MVVVIRKSTVKIHLLLHILYIWIIMDVQDTLHIGIIPMLFNIPIHYCSGAEIKICKNNC